MTYCPCFMTNQCSKGQFVSQTTQEDDPFLYVSEDRICALDRFEKVKALLVKMQDKTLYPVTDSPLLKVQSVLMMLAVTACEGRRVRIVDIGHAYLNAQLLRSSNSFATLLVNKKTRIFHPARCPQ